MVVGRGEWSSFTKTIASRFRLWLDGDGWFVSLFIYYREKATNILVTFSLNEKFTTYDGAVEAGLAAAQTWIDGGKPA
jgi:hypothetical protein